MEAAQFNTALLMRSNQRVGDYQMISESPTYRGGGLCSALEKCHASRALSRMHLNAALFSLPFGQHLGPSFSERPLTSKFPKIVGKSVEDSMEGNVLSDMI